MIIIYKIQRKDTGKYYVGKTTNILKRIKTHFSTLKNNVHHNLNLQKEWIIDNLSEDSFYIILLDSVFNEDEACFLEEYYISIGIAENKCYNIGLNSKGGDNFTNHPDKDKIRINSAKTISKLSDVEKKKRFSRPGKTNPMYGKNHTIETKTKISEMHKGNKYRLGAILSPSARKAISEFAKTRVGNLNPFYGKHHSIETKAKISKCNLGKKPINMRQVIMDGVTYESVTELSRVLNVTPGLIVYKLKSNNWPNYQYL